MKVTLKDKKVAPCQTRNIVEGIQDYYSITFLNLYGKVLQNTEVKAFVSDLHSKDAFVPAYKVPNNVIINRKKHHLETLNKNCYCIITLSQHKTQSPFHVKCRQRTSLILMELL